MIFFNIVQFYNVSHVTCYVLHATRYTRNYTTHSLAPVKSHLSLICVRVPFSVVLGLTSMKLVDAGFGVLQPFLFVQIML